MSLASFSGLTASNPAAELLFTRVPAWRASFSRWLPFLVPERMPRGSPALEQTRASPVLNDELLSSVQLLSPVRLFATPWTAALQASLSITNSRAYSNSTSITLVMPSNHLILCHPLLLPPSIKGHGNPLQYSCLENSTDRGAWRAIVHELTKSQARLNSAIIYSPPEKWGSTEAGSTSPEGPPNRWRSHTLGLAPLMGVSLEGPHRSQGGPSRLVLWRSPLSPTLSPTFLLAGETGSHQAGCPDPEVLAQDPPSKLPSGNESTGWLGAGGGSGPHGERS